MFQYRIAVKLPIIVIGVTVSALLAMGIFAYFDSSREIRQAASDKLIALMEARRGEISRYLSGVKEDVSILAGNPYIQDVLEKFDASYLALGKNAGAQLQKLYIANNPHPVGKKHLLDVVSDGSKYAATHQAFHPWMRRFIEQKGYYDAFLIDDDGNIVYTTFKERDFATNLVTGAWKDTELGRLFQRLKESRRSDFVGFSDFTPYAPSNDEPASFIGAPILGEQNRFIGALVFQMPISRINAVMQVASGMGKSGETYLIGQDRLMRSDSRFSKESSILKTKVDTLVASAALNGQSGVLFGRDYRETPVLSAYGPMDFMEVRWAVLAEIDQDEIDAPVLQEARMLAIGGLAIMFLAAFIGVMAARSIAQPISRMTESMSHLAAGQLDAQIPALEKKDEIGEMAAAVQVFKRNAIEKRHMDEAERKRLEIEKKNYEKQRAREQVIGQEIACLVDGVAKGDLSQRLSLADKEGFYLTISEGVNRLTESVSGVISDLDRVLSAQANGNLKTRMIRDYQGAFQTLKKNVDATSAKLQDVVGRITKAIDAIASAAEEVATGSGDLAERTEQQASSLEETAASMQQLGATVRQNAGNAHRVNEMILAALESAKRGGGVAVGAIDAMKQIAESSKRITDIIGVIDEIAFQTNLLALNAAVEAARAGDAGKGFAVVAQEVRILAQRSAQASKEIKALIMAGDSHVQIGVDMVRKAGDSLSGISRDVHDVSDLVREMARAGSEQASSLDQINSAVSQMDETTQKNAALVEETTAAAHSMSQQADDLHALVGFFKIA
ncbi:methyl-accepting chemotaxis protein [Azospirillaceae bacterium]